jgi:transketolase
LVELAAQNKDVVFISCDSSLGAGAGPFKKAYPERHFEFGIAEQNAMSHAAGLAISGKVPFIAAYVPFVTYRCFEQIRNDVAKTKLNVNIMGNNSGFSVSALGPTHTILEDVGSPKKPSKYDHNITCRRHRVYAGPVCCFPDRRPGIYKDIKDKSKRIYDEAHKLIVKGR